MHGGEEPCRCARRSGWEPCKWVGCISAVGPGWGQGRRPAVRCTPDVQGVPAGGRVRGWGCHPDVLGVADVRQVHHDVPTGGRRPGARRGLPKWAPLPTTPCFSFNPPSFRPPLLTPNAARLCPHGPPWGRGVAHPVPALPLSCPGPRPFERLGSSLFLFPLSRSLRPPCPAFCPQLQPFALSFFFSFLLSSLALCPRPRLRLSLICLAGVL